MKPYSPEIEEMIEKHVDGVKAQVGDLDKKQEFALRSSLRREAARYKEIVRGTVRHPKTPARNALCPCGSEKKYKHCCGNKSLAMRFVIIHRQSDNALRDNDGKILVWRTNSMARRMWLSLPQEDWYVGGMGVEKWNEFQKRFKKQIKEV